MSSGYISEALRDRIEAQAKSRCGYCRSQQKYVLGTLEIDHFIPRSKGGTDDEENLWLACSSCNVFKGVQTHAVDPLTRRRVRLFNPRGQNGPVILFGSRMGLKFWGGRLVVVRR